MKVNNIAFGTNPDNIHSTIDIINGDPARNNISTGLINIDQIGFVSCLTSIPGTNNNVINGKSITQISIIFTGSLGNAISNVALPSYPLDLNAWPNQHHVFIQGGPRELGAVIRATITSVS